MDVIDSLVSHHGTLRQLCLRVENFEVFIRGLISMQGVIAEGQVKSRFSRHKKRL